MLFLEKDEETDMPYNIDSIGRWRKEGDTERRPFRIVYIVVSINFASTLGCPHSHEISAPVLTVSQWGLQYLLSLAAKHLQPGCPQRFLLLSFISNPF
jgi:hypothetical protein